MWYVECLKNCYDAVDRTFYDAINYCIGIDHKDKKTQKLYEGHRVKNFQAFARQAEKRLRVLDAADTLQSLMCLPSSHFKSLTGERKGQYSIRINDQWRICFEWDEDSPVNVEIVDYH